jgi:hypothetical protein
MMMRDKTRRRRCIGPGFEGIRLGWMHTEHTRCACKIENAPVMSCRVLSYARLARITGRKRAGRF